jgi:hypothetical protein
MTSITRGSQPDTPFSGMCSIGYRGRLGTPRRRAMSEVVYLFCLSSITSWSRGSKGVRCRLGLLTSRARASSPTWPPGSRRARRQPSAAPETRSPTSPRGRSRCGAIASACLAMLPVPGEGGGGGGAPGGGGWCCTEATEGSAEGGRRASGNGFTQLQGVRPDKLVPAVELPRRRPIVRNLRSTVHHSDRSCCFSIGQRDALTR